MMVLVRKCGGYTTIDIGLLMSYIVPYLRYKTRYELDLGAASA
jgi:hypothetical protein